MLLKMSSLLVKTLIEKNINNYKELFNKYIIIKNHNKILVIVNIIFIIIFLISLIVYAFHCFY